MDAAKLNVIELRGEALAEYIEILKASGVIKNRRDLRGDLLKAYMADLYEKRARRNELERANPIPERKAEEIDDSAFSNLMKSIVGPRKLGE